MFTRCAICIIYNNIALIVLMIHKLRLWSMCLTKQKNTLRALSAHFISTIDFIQQYNKQESNIKWPTFYIQYYQFCS